MSKTIEILPQSNGPVLCLRLRGTVTQDDFITLFDKPLQDAVGKHGHYSLYVEYAPDFVAWSPEAADLSFKSITKFGPLARRCAYINPPKGRFVMMKLLDPIMKADVRYFNTGEEQDALAWVMEQDAG